MPEIRYREVYEQGTGVLLYTEPYEVSDEQLELEADKARIQTILEESPPVHGLPELYEAVRLLAKLQGYYGSP